MAALFSLVIGAALFGVISRFAAPPVAWIALPLLLHAVRSMRFAPGMALLWAALYVPVAIARRDTLPVPLPIYAVIMIVESAIVVLAFAVDRLMAPRLAGIAATLVFPLALTAMELLRARLTPAATWGSIAYSQYGFMPVMQVASVAGLWGITFLLGWSASVIELAWRTGIDWTQVRGPLAAFGLVMSAVLVAGSLRVVLAPTDVRVIRAVTLNRPIDFFPPGEMTRISEGRIDPADRDRVRDKLSRLHEWFFDGCRREARAGARLVAWPEQNLLVLAGDESAFLERAARVAADEHVYLAIGMGTIHLGDPLPMENKLVIIDPSGRTIVSHRKTRPVAGWEAGIMKRGTGPLPVVATADGRLAGAICFEGDFPEVIRDAGRGGADALVLVVNEWRTIEEIHLRMHAFRAIENGVSLIRPAASGLSAAIDPWGRTLGLAEFFAPNGGTMVAQVPMRHVPTLYARWGDWFAWLSIAALIVVTCAAAMR
jgi:apolipoprotein N-acyltransferase